MNTTADPSVTSYFIWLIRIVLPVVFFWLWFRSQSGKDGSGWSSGPQGNRHSKSQMLAIRDFVLGEPAPDAVATIRLVDAPKSAAPRRTAGDDKRAGKKGTGKGAPGNSKDGSGSPKKNGVRLTDAEKRHLESLLNYVAFNRKEEQQRMFLPTETVKPPPPPRKESVAKPQLSVLGGSLQAESDENSAEAAEANAEAQLVLRGIVNQKLGLRCSDVAKDLYKQLVGSQIHVAESTFSLVIEACINASDLKGASDILLKMEAAGHCPDSDLLDKVMDLYSKDKVIRTSGNAAVGSTSAPETSAFPSGGVGLSAFESSSPQGKSSRPGAVAPLRSSPKGSGSRRGGEDEADDDYFGFDLLPPARPNPRNGTANSSSSGGGNARGGVPGSQLNFDAYSDDEDY